MQTEKIILTTTVQATSNLVKRRFVNFLGSQCTASQQPLGVANAGYDAMEFAGVVTHGEIMLEAGGAVAIGDLVASDALGRAVSTTLLPPNPAFGRARTAANAAGDLLIVMN